MKPTVAVLLHAAAKVALWLTSKPAHIAEVRLRPSKGVGNVGSERLERPPRGVAAVVEVVVVEASKHSGRALPLSVLHNFSRCFSNFLK